MDHLFLNMDKPELLTYFLIAYLLTSKPHLMQVNCVEELHSWIQTQSSVSFIKVMKLALKLHSKYVMSLDIGKYSMNLPICKPDSPQVYQAFVRYPEHFVSFQNNIREKINFQEEEIEIKN